MSNTSYFAVNDVIVPDVRVDWMDIYAPGDRGKHSVRGIFPPDSEAEKVLKAAMTKAAVGLWGDNARNVVPSIPANNKCLRDGNANLDDDGNIRPNFAGMKFISAGNKDKPQVVAQRRHPTIKTANGQPAFIDIAQDGSARINGQIIDPPFPITVPYRGCYVNLKVTVVASKGKTIEKDGKKEQIPNQIYAKLEAVQFKRDGEAWGNGATSAEGFDDEPGGDQGAEVGSAAGDLF